MAVIYFAIVVPMQKLQELRKRGVDDEPEDVPGGHRAAARDPRRAAASSRSRPAQSPWWGGTSRRISSSRVPPSVSFQPSSVSSPVVSGSRSPSSRSARRRRSRSAFGRQATPSNQSGVSFGYCGCQPVRSQNRWELTRCERETISSRWPPEPHHGAGRRTGPPCDRPRARTCRPCRRASPARRRRCRRPRAAVRAATAAVPTSSACTTCVQESRAPMPIGRPARARRSSQAVLRS